MSPSGSIPPARAGDDAASSNEERLAELVGRLADLAMTGEIVDIDAVIRQQPEFGDELRELWGAVMLADAVGTSASASMSTDLEVVDEPIHSLDLPCQWSHDKRRWPF